MPLTSKSRLQKALPGCWAEQLSQMQAIGRRKDINVESPRTFRQSLRSPEVVTPPGGGGFAGRAPVPHGRPPHCGLRRNRRRAVLHRHNGGSAASTPTFENTTRALQLLQSNQRSVSATATETYYNNSGSPTSQSTVLPHVLLLPSNNHYNNHQVAPRSTSVDRKQTPISTPLSVNTATVDENHLIVNLLSINVKDGGGNGTAGSRPSSAGSGSSGGRKRGSPTSTDGAGGGPLSYTSSHRTPPKRSPRLTGLSLDSVDLWEDDLDQSDDDDNQVLRTKTTIRNMRKTINLSYVDPSTTVERPRPRTAMVPRRRYNRRVPEATARNNTPPSFAAAAAAEPPTTMNLAATIPQIVNSVGRPATPGVARKATPNAYVDFCNYRNRVKGSPKFCVRGTFLLSDGGVSSDVNNAETTTTIAANRLHFAADEMSGINNGNSPQTKQQQQQQHTELNANGLMAQRLLRRTKLLN